jgi:hypothetical protein
MRVKNKPISTALNFILRKWLASSTWLRSLDVWSDCNTPMCQVMCSFFCACLCLFPSTPSTPPTKILFSSAKRCRDAASSCSRAHLHLVEHVVPLCVESHASNWKRKVDGDRWRSGWLQKWSSSFWFQDLDFRFPNAEISSRLKLVIIIRSE